MDKGFQPTPATNHGTKMIERKRVLAQMDLADPTLVSQKLLDASGPCNIIQYIAKHQAFKTKTLKHESHEHA